MKHCVVTLALMAICCLSTQPLYASSVDPFKRCPDCSGLGRVETWYGQVRCENCGGDGKVCNWTFFGALAAVVYGIWCSRKK